MLIDFQGCNIASCAIISGIECFCKDGGVVQDPQCRWQGSQGKGSIISDPVVVESILELNRDQTRFVGLHRRLVGGDQRVCQVNRCRCYIDRPDLIHKVGAKLGADGVSTGSGNPYRCGIGTISNVVDDKWPTISSGSTVIQIH